MAIVQCADCGSNISDAAPACVHCGRPSVVPLANTEIASVAPPESKLRPVKRRSRFICWLSSAARSIGIYATVFGVASGTVGILASRHIFFDQFFTSQIARGEIEFGFGSAGLGILLVILSVVVGGAAAAKDESEPPIFGRATWIICPNARCGYRGQAKQQARGSTFVAVFLLLCGGLPGIIYIIVYSGYTLVCPRCGLKIRDHG